MKIIYTLDMIQFTEVSVCCECGEITIEMKSGDEGWTFCPECQCVEGETKQMFECPQCHEICPEAKCECFPNIDNDVLYTDGLL